MIYRSLVIVTGAFALAACGVDQATHVNTIVEKIPVPVQPIQPKDVPPPPVSLGPRPPTLQQTADTALAGWCEAVSYFLHADPLLRLSAGMPPAELPKYPECERH